MISITRKLSSHISQWIRAPNRKVLLLRGARQVGKTYLVREEKNRFRHYLEINFLSDKRAAQFFQGDLNVEKILEQLSTFYNLPIVDGETLLFFDEIQECKEALSALRFFQEKRPNLHVIGAGSLLEFALAELPSYGVGRVQSLFLYPVTFDEFLKASGEERLLDYLEKAGPAADPTLKNPLHDKLLDYFKIYLFLGGLPEVVANYLADRNLHQAANLIDSIRLAYEDDFIKYRRRTPESRLREVLRSTSLQAGKKFIHSHAYPDANAGQVHGALELLAQAGLVYRVYHSSCNGVPIGAEVDLKKFKTIPFDHGIYQRMLGVTPVEVVQNKFDPINKGALAEVYYGCALLAHSNPLLKDNLYYWHRESKSSNAEIDYALQYNDRIIPIEIKAATKGKMQSLYRFLEEKRRVSAFGIRSSLEDFNRYDKIIVVPLYAVSQIPRIVDEL